MSNGTTSIEHLLTEQQSAMGMHENRKITWEKLTESLGQSIGQLTLFCNFRTSRAEDNLVNAPVILGAHS